MIGETLAAPCALPILFVAAVCGWLYLRLRRPPGCPPGPLRLPVLGNLGLFRNDPRQVFEALQKQYGDIYSVYFGQELAVVVHGFDNIKEAFVRRGDVFSGRPASRLSEQVCPDKGLITLSGEAWRRERKLSVLALSDLGFRKALAEDRIFREVTCFVEQISENRGKPFDISLPIHTSMANVISSFILGKRFEYTDQKFQNYISRLLENYRAAGATAALNYLPFLDYLPGDLFKFKKTLANIFHIVDFIRAIVQERREAYDPENIQDFVGAYIKRVEDSGATVDEEQLTQAITHMFVAGTESVATAIRWILFYLCKFPDIQEKLRTEIDTAATKGTPISWQNKDMFPFTMATCLEVMRHADLAPLGVAHSATEDAHFRGYFIPKGAMIIPYVHGVLHDRDFWRSPEKFNPGRFLDATGHVTIPEQFIPYSIASISQRFRFRLEDGPQPALSDSQMGLTVTPMPFRLVFEDR